MIDDEQTALVVGNDERWRGQDRRRSY